MKLRGATASLRKLDPPTIRAMWWTGATLRRTRRQLARTGLDDLNLAAAPRDSIHAARGVDALLRLLKATCLERALIRQAWYRGHGVSKALIIGVTSPREGFRAHAWLEGDPSASLEPYTELLQRPPA